MAYSSTYIDPYIQAQLAGERRTATTEKQIQTQRNIFGLNTANQQYSQNLGDLAERYRLNRDRLPGPFAGRGLLNSGIYHNALTELQHKQMNDVNAANQGWLTQVGQYGLSQQENQLRYQATLANLAQEQQALQQQAAIQRFLAAL